MKCRIFNYTFKKALLEVDTPLEQMQKVVSPLNVLMLNVQICIPKFASELFLPLEYLLYKLFTNDASKISGEEDPHH